MNTTKTNAIRRFLNAIIAISILSLIKKEFATQIQIYLPTPAKRSGVADMRYVIYIIIAFLIGAILFPIAMTQVTAATTTSWGAGVGPIFAQLLPILVIIAIALHIFGFV